MATTTTNFGWDIPQSTDLVKDGATAIAALGQDIDTALVDLKGGTTGQILSKASNTDLDFSWASAPSISGLTLIHTETLSAVSAVNIDSKFTSTYANYLVMANIEQSTANVMTVQYRSAGSSITSGYKSTYWYTEYTSNTWNVTSSASASNIWSVSTSTDRALLSMIIGDPQVSEFTKAQIVSTDNTYNLGYYSVYPQTTAIDGLRFSTSTGSMTGNIRIYGYQNS
jgi:hypothetical protein